MTFGSGADAVDFQGVVPTNSTLGLTSGTLSLDRLGWEHGDGRYLWH